MISRRGSGDRKRHFLASHRIGSNQRRRGSGRSVAEANAGLAVVAGGARRGGSPGARLVVAQLMVRPITGLPAVSRTSTTSGCAPLELIRPA